MNVTDLLEKARSKGIKIVTAESCTGGMVAVALTDIPGSSDVVERGLVTYSNEAKIELLDISPRTLSEFGAVSEEIAREMADGALKNSYAQLAVSITGIAGPGGSEHKPEGRVCFGLAMQGKPTRTETQEFGARGRDKVREMARDHALALLDAALS
ncbi:CinA family protein [Roseovarius indicus]|uniref:Damage-inducible protein CinA n=1 Tax=Roseovarius indicus TaxID=540747 RepID=A0A0T5P9U7_9RHOB|nr:CinA family protein [Roseovarius indicus]KRS18043.1 damage-inducible protein CinA [Roseovarius indicus]QEW27130.1 Nicotinamide-nucleotide amidohydrolase PncC [Roseovarius indicus]SFD53645.1 nicotinamide-nucleotide amidase [Roseovarius indicus]